VARRRTRYRDTRIRHDLGRAGTVSSYRSNLDYHAGSQYAARPPSPAAPAVPVRPL
jgi:hypothetical protein